MSARVKPRQGGTPEEHLRYMLRYGLKFVPEAGVVAAAKALLPFLNAGQCPRVDADCRPGACNCDGAHDALAYALRKQAQGDATPEDGEGLAFDPELYSINHWILHGGVDD